MLASATASDRHAASVGSSAARNSCRKRSISAGETPCRKRTPPTVRRSNSDRSEW